MNRRLSTFTALLAVLLGGVFAASSLEAQSNERSVLDGVFTGEQVSQGESAFTQECALCHSTREFSGRLFQIAWTNRTVHDLYRNIATTMPYDRPGSLSGEQYAAIVAYILEMNGYPTGEEALDSEEEALSAIRIDPLPDDGP